jgi:hypothetical protein
MVACLAPPCHGRRRPATHGLLLRGATESRGWPAIAAMTREEVCAVRVNLLGVWYDPPPAGITRCHPVVRQGLRRAQRIVPPARASGHAVSQSSHFVMDETVTRCAGSGGGAPRNGAWGVAAAGGVADVKLGHRPVDGRAARGAPTGRPVRGGAARDRQASVNANAGRGT